jgi:hypothetical protein
MRAQTTIPAAIAATLAVGMFATACQEVEQPSPVLTGEQWNKVKDHIDDPKESPEPEYKIGANFDDKIELVGFSVGDPNKKEESIVAGQETTFRWYWKVLGDMDKNWKIFIHFDSKDSKVDPAKRRQNLDHQPLDGLFPTSKWPKGKIIEDVQKVTIRQDYPSGPAVPYIGFYRGKTRLPIKNDVPKTNDRRVKAPSLTVTGGSQGSNSKSKGSNTKDDKPSYAVHTLKPEAAEGLTIDGKLDESIWSEIPKLNLSPFGSGPKLESTVRTFRAGDHLYIGAHLQDEHAWSSKDERDSATWEQEVFEMFVDTDGDGDNYLELQINPIGTIFDANFKKRLGTGEGSRGDQINRAKKFNIEGLESAVHVEGTVNDKAKGDEFWSVELKIPLTSIPGVDSADEPGKTWAVNFYRFDRPTDERTLSFAWSTKPRGDFHQVGKFGEFRFSIDPSTIKKQLDPKIMKALEKNPPAPQK